MQYRRFGRLDWQVSALGFGTMRLPTLGGESANIDEAEATRMLHYAIDHGVNYVDTAYPYHEGNSERWLGRALQGGYREKIRLATKLPCWDVQVADDFDRFLDEQLERLRTGHVDFYLLHALNAERWQKMRGLNVLERAERALADGRVGYLGFSFHGGYEAFQEIIDGYDGWTLCQIQYNYMDVENQAGIRGLKYAAAKGLAVVVMEPVMGGRLADPPDAVRRIWDRAARKRSPVDWALQWVWNQPEVSVALSGMSAMRQVEENVASAASSGVGSLSAEELALYDQVRAEYRNLVPIPCTRCDYCMPCPNGVHIPRNFAIYNDGLVYNRPDHARDAYNNRMPVEARASACIQCRECEDKCPQSIPISEWLIVVHQVLGEGKPYVRSLAG